MKAAWIMLALAVVTLHLGLCCASATLTDTNRAISLTYDFDQPHVEDDAGQVRISVSGCQTLSRAGEPSRPFRTAKVLLPPGFQVVNVVAQAARPPVVLPGPWPSERGRRLASPWKPDDRPAQPGGHTPPARPHVASTADRLIGPAQLVSVQRLLGCEIALIRLFPVEYQSTNGQLRFAPRLNLTLTLAPSEAKPPLLFLTRGQAGARQRVASWVDNPGMLSEYQAAQAAIAPDAPATCDYLLITRAALVPSFQPLLELKTRRGLSVKVETMETITASQPGRDAPEKLRHYIRHACTNWGVEYVLLGGDTATVPCRYAFVPQRRPEKDCLVPCDLYFACLDGTWNRDRDSRWGEPTDGEDAGEVDLLAEVDIGRAPVDTVAEAAAFVEKTVRHETRRRSDPAEVLLLATFLEHASAQGGDMFDPLLPFLNPFEVRRLDDRPAVAPGWTAADAVRELSRSPRLALYSGHADSDQMMRLSSADVGALTNEHPFLVYSVGCNAGQFDNDPFSPDCIAEEIVMRNRHGAFAVLCNPRVGWYEPREVERFSGEFQIHFFEQLLHRGQTNVGRASQLAKHQLVGQVETSGTMPYRWCYYEITLLGDPHTSIDAPACTPIRERAQESGRTAVALGIRLPRLNATRLVLTSRLPMWMSFFWCQDKGVASVLMKMRGVDIRSAGDQPPPERAERQPSTPPTKGVPPKCNTRAFHERILSCLCGVGLAWNTVRRADTL